MPIDQITHLEYTTNEWTKEPFIQMLEIIFSDETITNFIDIGANVGGVINALHLLGHLKKINKIVCFEPDIDNYNFLKNICQNINTADNIDITCHNFGIYYGKNQGIVCGTGDGNIGGYFIQDDYVSYRDHPVVPFEDKVFNLDIIEKYIEFEIDVVKIDIEGSEMNVLEHSSIIKNSKFIILEWHFNVDQINSFILTHLPNFVIIYDGGNTNYLLKNKNRG